MPINTGVEAGEGSETTLHPLKTPINTGDFSEKVKGEGKFATLTFLCGCSNDDPTDNSYGNTSGQHLTGNVPNVIVDTDLGNCMDDALAMQVLFKYRSKGKQNLLAAMNGCKVEKAKQLLKCLISSPSP